MIVDLNYTKTNRKDSLYFILLTSFSLLAYLLLNLFIIKKAPKVDLLITGLNIIPFFVFFYFVLSKEIKTLLILITLLPLFIISVTLHYFIKYIIIQDIPLIFLSLLALIQFLVNSKSFSIKINYFSKPLLLFFLYSIFLAFFALIRKNNPTFILDEFYHTLYYPFGLVIFYMLGNRKDYYIIILFLIFFEFVFSIINIYMNLFTSLERFVTFQSYISPFVLGLLFSYIIFYQRNKNLYWYLAVFLFTVITFGIFITMTRSLWASILITFGSILFYFLWKIRKVNIIKIILLYVLLSAPLVFFISNHKQTKITQKDINDINYRTSSLANPLEDTSFLMRMEIDYYSILHFLESPIIGKGFGDFVQYKFMSVLRNKIIYPDNSWLFFLWKGGLVGFLIVVFLYYRWAKTLLFIFNFSQNELTRAISLGILGGLLGLVFLGLFNAILIKYKVLVYFSALIGYTQYEYSNIDNDLSDI